MDSEKNTRTTVEFEHKFFSAVEGSYFRKSAQTADPVFIVSLGDEEAALPIAGIKRELDISEEAPDQEMLELVIAGLDYVKVLSVGDALPTELLTGEASWEVTDEHRIIAKQRIYNHLVSWMAGDDAPFATPKQLLQMSEDDEMKQQVATALDKAAADLDCPSEEIHSQVVELANELAFIEGLRLRFGEVLLLERKINLIRQTAKRMPDLLNITASVSRLLSAAVSAFKDDFTMIDGQTGEIISTLRNIAVQTEYIRSARNTLYRRFMAWDDTLLAWTPQTGVISHDTADLMGETYRFLAPRYMQTDDWLLSSKQQNQRDQEEVGARW